MVPVHMDIGADTYVNVLEILAITSSYPEIKYSFPVDTTKKLKAAIFTTSGLVLPAYRAPDILAKRWQETFERRDK